MFLESRQNCMLSPSLMYGWTTFLNSLLRTSAPPATVEDGLLVLWAGVILELNAGTNSFNAAAGGSSEPCLDCFCSSRDFRSLGLRLGRLSDHSTQCACCWRTPSISFPRTFNRRPPSLSGRTRIVIVHFSCPPAESGSVRSVVSEVNIRCTTP